MLIIKNSLSMYQKNNIIRIGVLSLWLIGASFSSQAQIYDWVEDFVEKQVTKTIKGYLKDSASNFWDNLVDKSARNSIRQKSGELAHYYPANLDSLSFAYNPDFVYTNGMINVEKTFANIKPKTLQKFRKEIDGVSDLSLASMGRGYIQTQSNAFVLERAQESEINDLSKVLNDETMAYVREKVNGDKQRSLLADINAHPALIPALNANVTTLDYYLKLKEPHNTDAQELLYWAQYADRISSRLPKKAKFIKLPFIEFTPYGQAMAISYDGVLLANYSPKKKLYSVVSPEFLHLNPRPDHTYEYEGTNFVADPLGRITEISFWGDKKRNKTSKKLNLKLKDLMSAHNVDSKNNLYSAILKDFNLTPASGYLVRVKDMKSLKSKIKDYKKELKSLSKANPNARCIVKLIYSDHSNVLSDVELSFDNISRPIVYASSHNSKNKNGNDVKNEGQPHLTGSVSGVSLSKKIDNIKNTPKIEWEQESLVKKKVYIDLGIAAPSNIGIYAALGGYIHRFNMEGSVVYGLQKSQEFYFTGTLPLGSIQHSSNTYSAVDLGFKMGYGIPCGRRVMLTPQVGVNPVIIHGTDKKTCTLDVASSLSVVGALRAYFAISNNIGITLIPEYKLKITTPETVTAMANADSRVKNWLEGVTGKISFTICF